MLLDIVCVVCVGIHWLNLNDTTFTDFEGLSQIELAFALPSLSLSVVLYVSRGLFKDHETPGNLWVNSVTFYST